MKPIQFPLARITLFFILGILIAFYGKPSLSVCVSFLFISICIFAFGYVKNQYFGVSCFILSIAIGISTMVFHTRVFDKKHFINQIGTIEKSHLLEITLKEKLKNTLQNTRFVANINRFDNKKSVGKIIFNIRKDSLFHNLSIGSILKVNAFVYKNRIVNNPNQFDYGQYLLNQQVYGQVYANINEIEISTKIHKDVWFYAAHFRNKIITNLEKSGFAKTELAVIVALILGQQQDISPDILQDYQFAGAIHILSVSGLHVGFILLFIGFILKPFPNNHKAKFIKLIITLLSLWLFGFIAGLAPSILRSVVMFSFVIIGQYLKRGVNIFHTLLVSAFLILLFKPSFLFDVGFQLSYISLFFILWLQPLLAEVWMPKNKFINYFWQILTVSFAAQIGAFPLSIYYFHQFPGLFFITNLVVLPFIGLIMGYGVFIMLLAYFDIVPQLPVKILEYAVLFLNKIIAIIASIEQFIIQNISMNVYMLLSLYFMIVAIILWLKKPSFNKLSFALLSVLLFQISCITTKFYVQNQHELIVFNVKKETLIAKRLGNKTTVYQKDKMNFDINKSIDLKSYLIGNFSNVDSIKKTPSLLYFKNQKLLILDSIAIYPTSISPDILLITHSPKLNLDRFLKSCKPKIIIADNSNFKSYIKRWQSTCINQNILFHNCSDQSFFRL
jgi:competence protein ComEC